MEAIRGRGDLILGAIVAAALHGVLLLSFPGTHMPARLDGRLPGPLEISLRGPERPLPVPAPPAVSETPPRPEERKKVERKSPPPVKEEVVRKATTATAAAAVPKKPEAAVRREPAAPPESDAGSAAPESVPAEAVAALPAPETPGEAGTRALTRQAVRYRDNPAPPYPGPARRRGHEGTVLLAVEVLAEGTPGRIHVERSSGHPILDDAALQAVREWRFEPAVKNGTPVPSWVEVPIRFVLGSPEEP